jgi:MFS family permease
MVDDGGREVDVNVPAGTPRAGAFRAMRVRNYRLFFAGQVLSVIGTWTQATAVGWIVLRETHDSTGLGIVVALQFLPLLVLGAYAGTLADRIDKRRILIAANVAAAVIALATAVLVSDGHRSVALLAAASLLLGCTTAFETPTR